MTEDSLNDLLQPDTSKQKTDLDVLKELFKLKNIETKTELSMEQVILFNQKRSIAKLLDWETLDKCLLDFMLLMVSHKRQGRSEFVEGFKSEREQNIRQQQGGSGGILQGMKNRMGWQ